jgi:homoserine kinase type II
MAVYTRVTQSQLEAFIQNDYLAQLVSFEGIKDGIDNSNFLITTSRGNFILTLFESLDSKQLPDYLKLLVFLDNNKIACPAPFANKQSQFLNSLNNKPAVIFKCLPGKSVVNPTIHHCHAIGEQLAKIHRCCQNYHFPINNNRNLIWCEKISTTIQTRLSREDRLLLRDEIDFQLSFSSSEMPKGLIHGDLFRDNVFFLKQKVSGILDFYNACTDYLLLDIAITINDWCMENHRINSKKVSYLLTGYEKIRPLFDIEKQNLAVFLRRAALRFWLSRLDHQLNPRPGQITQTKNPSTFKNILQQHRQ